MHSKNLNIVYLMVSLFNRCLWYAPWLLYVYQFLDVSQVVTLTSITLITAIVTEVPTGAISDLVGKKKTLQLALITAASSEILTIFATEFWQFALLWMVTTLGFSFYSGTMEAFIYDTLVEKHEEEKYPLAISKMQRFRNMAIVIASVSGGFMFKFWPGAIFFFTGLAKIIALMLSTQITEPKVDTDHFSWTNFIKQNYKGFSHLFSKKMFNNTILILIFGCFFVLSYEILDDLAVVDWGLTASQIGILYAIGTFLSVPASYLYPKISRKFTSKVLIKIGIGILIVNYIFSPHINATIWIAIFFLRVFYSPIRDSAISELINQETESKIRATTLSTYELARRIPYALLAVPLGIMMKSTGIKVFSSYFALTLLGCLLLYLFFNWLKMRSFFSPKD